MRRFLMPATVALAVLVAASACGGGGTDDSQVEAEAWRRSFTENQQEGGGTDDLQAQTEASSETTRSLPDDSGESRETGDDTETDPESDDVTPGLESEVEPPEVETPEVETPEVETPEVEPPEVEVEAGQGTDGADTDASEAVEVSAAEGAGDPEAVALLSDVMESPVGGAVRGEATLGVPGGEFTGSLTVRFERDVEGDLAVFLDIPAGFDETFPEGFTTESRYVDGVAYVRLPLDAETLAELGYEDEVWFKPQQAAANDNPMAESLGPAAGLMCLFPDSPGEFPEDCDPLGESTGLLELARGAEIVGREEVRGVPATKVRFRVSLASAEGSETSEVEGMLGGEEMFGQIGEMLSGLGIDAEVWIDDDKLIRRVTLSLDLGSLLGAMGANEGGMPQSLSISIDFYDHGADISVEAPPPESVDDDPNLFRLLADMEHPS